ncbi:cobalamin biosynthesis protein CobQ [Oceaniovalibus sp. ACAM 378]|uniref:cobalamin biosynthesis protein CobQ n=1 Tax=Oceaniovalibus sp. ACAM 378 TaxID=2599923 RepID=UPI0011D975C5|nr:cobalamin biosynthesis protein CobQ [Oceaniovalibus sp. ACAM 378]TYB90051.1 cobalamin biosynthesis protein CobQ [Oceaniovalibus sp. ACAM 378]
MNTPSHILIGAAVFSRPMASSILFSALFGGLAPDLPILMMVLWSTRLLGIPEHEVFGQLYFSDTWQAVFAIDHGFLVWGSLFGLAAWRGSVILRAFAGSGLLHASADFLTHHDDARRQFWPVSDWVFQSPVSYWDGRFYGDIFAPLELGLVIALAAFLLWRLEKWRDRLAVLAVAAVVVVPALWTGSLHGLHGMG